MREVDGILASQPYEQILVVVRHAHHFVRNNLLQKKTFTVVKCWSYTKTGNYSSSARGDYRTSPPVCFEWSFSTLWRKRNNRKNTKCKPGTPPSRPKKNRPPKRAFCAIFSCLSYGEDEIVPPFPHQAVDLGRPGNIQMTARCLVHNLRGHVPDLSFIGARKKDGKNATGTPTGWRAQPRGRRSFVC